MAFGEELLKALSATQYKAADSPYAIGSQAINAVTPNLVNPYGSTGSNLAITAGSGMLAALLAGLAENDAQSKNAAFAPSISAFMQADPTQQAQLAAKEPRLSSLYNAMLANSLTNDMELKQEKAKYETLSPLRVQEEVNKYTALQPYKQDETLLNQTNQLLSPEGKLMVPGEGIVEVTNPLQREVELDAEKIKNDLLKSQGRVRLGGKLEQVLDVNQQKYNETFATEKAKDDALKLAGAKIPATLIPEFAQSKGVIDQALNIAGALDSTKTGWAGLRAAEQFSGLDDEGIAAAISDLSDRVLRLRSGASAPSSEQNKLRKIAAGDRTVSPQEAASLLRKFAKREQEFALSQVDLIESGTNPASLRESFQGVDTTAQPQATGRFTPQGKQIYILNGVEGVID